MGHARQKTLLGNEGASSSSGSAIQFVGDSRLLSLSIQSGSNASASQYTVRISNADGFSASIPAGSWSVVTTIPNQGAYTLDPGGRWLMVERPNFGISGSSCVTMSLNRYFE